MSFKNTNIFLSSNAANKSSQDAQLPQRDCASTLSVEILSTAAQLGIRKMPLTKGWQQAKDIEGH